MFVNINGNQLHIEVLGGDDPAKPVLIAHHGAPGLGSLAEPKAAFGPLADRFRVVVFDARGSGASGDTPPFTHEQWVADVDALRAWMGVERFVMAGGSYGGFISMEYAVRFRERLLALVLRDTSADSTHDELAEANARSSDRVEIDDERYRRVMEGRVVDNDDLRDCWRHLLPLYDHELDLARVAERVANTPYHYAKHNYAFAVNRLTYDVKPQLSTVTCPTLVTVGRHDWITPVSASETIAELVPGAQLVVFERSGHSPPLEEPERFQQVVRTFLDDALAVA